MNAIVSSAAHRANVVDLLMFGSFPTSLLQAKTPRFGESLELILRDAEELRERITNYYETTGGNERRYLAEAEAAAYETTEFLTAALTASAQ